MPELPDLEVFSKNLRKKLLNKDIVSAAVFNSPKVNVTSSEFQQKLVSSQIESIIRSGKELSFKLTNNNIFNVHLMLNGKFEVINSQEVKAVKSKIVGIDFEDGCSLVVHDFQGLCKVTLNPEDSIVPDALSDEFSFDYFVESIKKNARKNIKAFLINQDIVRGIGNAYADEILFDANISPESNSGKITEEYLSILYKSIKDVLMDAILKIEKASPDIISGEERSFLKVHNKNLKHTQDGKEILVKKVASKTTYMTEEQILFK